MKSVFWHTLKSLFQAEILTSLIFTLCFNVTRTAKNSDGGRSDGRGLFSFLGFFKESFFDVGAEVLYKCLQYPYIAMAGNAQM